MPGAIVPDAERLDHAMVVIPFAVSAVIAKGEVTERYFNPGNLFRSVDLVITMDDDPDPAALQPMFGDAEVRVHALGRDRWDPLRTLGWRPGRSRHLLREVRAIAQASPPALVRCYASGLAPMAAFEVREQTGAPVVVSIHTIPDDPAAAPFSVRHRVGNALHAAVEREGVRGADLTVAVYRSLLPYLDRLGASRVEVAYNVLAETTSHVKTSYELHRPARLLSVGRQIPGKDPTPIIDAVATIPDIELVLVGDGPLHGDLQARVDRLGVSDRVTFEPAIANDVLCASFADHDVFVASNRYQGIPKAFMEPMLAGLPIVTDRATPAVPEIEESGAVVTDGTAAGFAVAITALLDDGARRAAVGSDVRAYATARWAPEAAERRYVELYRSVLGDG